MDAFNSVRKIQRLGYLVSVSLILQILSTVQREMMLTSLEFLEASVKSFETEVLHIFSTIQTSNLPIKDRVEPFRQFFYHKRGFMYLQGSVVQYLVLGARYASSL